KTLVPTRRDTILRLHTAISHLPRRDPRKTTVVQTTTPAVSVKRGTPTPGRSRAVRKPRPKQGFHRPNPNPDSKQPMIIHVTPRAMQRMPQPRDPPSPDHPRKEPPAMTTTRVASVQAEPAWLDLPATTDKTIDLIRQAAHNDA